MVIGIGTDILEISRIESTRRTGTENRIFTEHERRQASGRDSMLAGGFACKEAVAKCFGTGFRGFRPIDVEVLRDALGKPYVVLHGGARTLYEQLGGRSIQVSISDTKELVIAFAILEGADGNRQDDLSQEDSGTPERQ